jgi:transposase
MAQKGLSMSKIREVLRLRSLGLLQQEIARSCCISQPTVHRYLERADAAGLSWPLPEDCDDRRLKELLFPPQARSSLPTAASQQNPTPNSKIRRIAIDFAALHRELQTHKHVTLQLLWEEYCKNHTDDTGGSPYSYTRLCELYHNWRRKLDVVLRQDHRAGEKMFVDWAGTTIPIFDRATGESKPAYLFVAVLGGSSYTFAVAKPSQQLPHWIACHIQALEFFQGAPQLVVPDNPRPRSPGPAAMTRI